MVSGDGLEISTKYAFETIDNCELAWEHMRDVANGLAIRKKIRKEFKR